MSHLIHSSAFALTKSIVNVVGPVLRPEEVRDVFDEIYTRCKAALRDYEQMRDRQHSRIHPSEN